MITVENLSRRSILRGIGIGSGLVLGFRVGFRSFPAGAAPQPVFVPNVYVSIDDSGLVTIVDLPPEKWTPGYADIASACSGVM